MVKRIEPTKKQPKPMVNEPPPSKDLTERVSANITARRKALGLTQVQLAARLTLTAETVSRFERGAHLPSLATLESLAAALELTVGDLLAEQVRAVDEPSLMVASWLRPLSPDDRDFVQGVLRMCCDRLAQRPLPVASGELTYEVAAAAQYRTKQNLEEMIDVVLNLIAAGGQVVLRVKIAPPPRSGMQEAIGALIPVTTDNVYELYRHVPAVRDTVLARFPGADKLEKLAEKAKQQAKKRIGSMEKHRDALGQVVAMATDRVDDYDAN